MMTWHTALFSAVFLLQIFLLSWYFPRRIAARVQRVLEEHPPAEYPKLYPRSAEYYRLGLGAFTWLNRIIIGLGFVALWAALVIDGGSFADDGYISEAWPAVYGILQSIPLVLVEIAELKRFRQMRAELDGSKRKASLTPRRLRDFISPWLLVTAAALFAGFVLLDLWVHDFRADLGHDTMQRAMIIGGVNLLFIVLGTITLRRKPLDPHQETVDWHRAISANLHALAAVSIIASLFQVPQILDDVIELSFLDATLMSVYFMAVVTFGVGLVMRMQNLDDMNFEVYRDKPVLS